MNTWTIARRVNRLMRQSTFLLLLAIGLSSSLLAQGVRVGPQPIPQKPANVDVYESKGFLKTRMNIPSLRLAIPVLDPGIPESTQEQSNQGIWPELRKSESVWAAFKLKEWVHRYNQFDSIVVSADASVSADVYFIGRIERSDGETMRINYQVVDATGDVWLPDMSDSHRVEIGWHQRNEGTGQDPFDPLYNEIAETVYEALKDRGKTHVEKLERESRRKNQEERRLTDLERIAVTRDLAFARFLSPREFGDALVATNGRYEIQYLPQTDGSDWARIGSIQVREDDFAKVIEKYYAEFADTIKEEYSQWQRDSFPIARELRIAKRNRTLQGIAGAALVVASVAAERDGAAAEGDGSAQLGTRVGAALGGSLLVSSFVNNERRKVAVAEINELGGSLHNSLKPTRVDLNGKIVTLSGTVHDQFTQWRTMLTEMYESTEQDIESVQILEQEENVSSE